MRQIRLPAALAVLMLGIPGCSGSSTPGVEESAPSPGQVRITGTLVTDLQSPWSVLPLPDGNALISERDSGRILLVDPDSGDTSVAGEIPDVFNEREAGVMGLALSPDGESVYVMYTTEQDNRVVALAWNGEALGAARPILTGIPNEETHNGGRIIFGPDGMLYVATGDARRADASQDLDSLAGKILRVTPDGAVPEDNPFTGSPVYSLGHRNVQGLAFDDGGRLWASEFGSSDYDELNLIEPGGNYGWPDEEGPGDDPQYLQPQIVWSPTSEASPSGMAYVDGSLWIAALRGQRLLQVELADGQVGETSAHLVDSEGRLRDAVAAPGGGLWVLTNNTDGRGEPRPQDDKLLSVEVD